MNIQFNLHYKTNLGEMIGIEYHFNEDPDDVKIMSLYTFDGENWSGKLEISYSQVVKYNYVLLKDGEITVSEWGKPREILFYKYDVVLKDSWRSRANINNAFLSSAFTKAIYRRVPKNTKKIRINPTEDRHTIQFQFLSTTIDPSLCFGIIGSISELGNWKKTLIMDDSEFPLWTLTVNTDKKNQFIEYKYVIVNPETKDILYWEGDENRRIYTTINNEHPTIFRIYDDGFRHLSMWRGAGVAVPVFSLRSQKGMGIGEFLDLKLLIDWSHNIGLSVIQVLPVNDTTATKTWLDSYPYSAISAFALQPLYIHLPDIAKFKDENIQASYNEDVDILNRESDVDFEKVLELKFNYLRVLFKQEYENYKKDIEVSLFLDANKEWLPQYVVFCHFRDKYNTVNFSLWPQHNIYSDEIVNQLFTPEYVNYSEIEFYCFIQFHADKQLKKVRDYARSKRVVLKGDLPIGIYRYSCDAWVAPELYNMGGQSGAPPDDFTVLGQNWGFPTYNWQEMFADDFSWWQKRMKQLNRYFDALRMDHILGFFRIWEIPISQIQGTMGMFNPRLPLSVEELEQYEITGDLSRFIRPYITDDRIRRAFGSDAEEASKIFFSKKTEGTRVFKAAFDNQIKIRNYINNHTKYSKYEEVLLEMISDVLLIKELKSEKSLYNPRITLSTTYSYSQLDSETKVKFDKLYNDYFFIRHNEYWRNQALWKLPWILDASDMLICGEDLGMIPQSVPGVMNAMNILSLEIQRMPKDNSEFGIVRNYPYMSICSSSSHDMSTIRGWWEADEEVAGRFFHNYLHWFGVPPKDCTSDIVKTIVDDHLSSPSMLAIFPIQDLIGMDATLRNPDAASEQINEPSNPQHNWKFRYHLPVERLLEATHFNDMLKAMLKVHGR